MRRNGTDVLNDFDLTICALEVWTALAQYHFDLAAEVQTGKVETSLRLGILFLGFAFAIV